MTVTGATTTVAGISPAELAAMHEAAGAFRRKFAGGRTVYTYAGPGQGAPNHSHLAHNALDAARFAVLARPHRAGG